MASTSSVATSSTAPRASVLGPTGALVVAEAEARGERVSARLVLASTLLDYGLPGHPVLRGGSALGAVLRGTLAWRGAPEVEVEAGVLGRVPYALALEPEAGALPVLALSLRPWGDDRLVLRFGSLDTAHGHHPAVVDEARYAYGRPYAAAYLQSLPGGVARALGPDPFMPAEHGAQAVLQLGGWLRADGYLDWQLLETAEHREKLALGLVAAAEHPRGRLSLEARLGHYGGERYTRTDPVRAAGLDPVRQPLTLAAAGRLHAHPGAALALEVPVAWVWGRLAQRGGEAPSAHQGLELGLEAVAFGRVRLGWLHYTPLGAAHGWVGEDGEPVYSGPRSERLRLGLAACFGPLALRGRLDVVLTQLGQPVEYLTVTTATWRWTRELSGRAAQPPADAEAPGARATSACAP